jgi:hypothetical protein
MKEREPGRQSAVPEFSRVAQFKKCHPVRVLGRSTIREMHMKVKPGPHAARGAMAAALMLLLAGCAGYGDTTDDQAAAPATPAPAAGDATPITTTPATPTPDTSMPAAGGAPQASPAVPPPVYPAPNAGYTYSGPNTAPAPIVDTPADVSVPDGTLTANIKSALAAHSTTRGLRVQVSVHEGVVILHGAVGSSVQVDQLKSVITDVQGVKEVDTTLLKHGR